MKEAFIDRKFTADSMVIIEMANSILNEYAAMGYRLTLRQLYYQFIARDLLPSSWADKETRSTNNLRSYKRLGTILSHGRQAGVIDWDAMEDRNRETVSNAHWENPGQIVMAAARQFQVDKWADQDYHVEVMVEKDALSGVLEPVCGELDVAVTANKGYSSSSTMYEIGKRLEGLYNDDRKSIVILYLGDHDPSGIDMSRDVEDRLRMYSNSADVEVRRLALNWDQVQLWNPPENPAKDTDARAKAYMAQYGNRSWELDAIEINTLAALVRDAVLEYRDADLWDDAVEKEQNMKAELMDFARKYGTNGR